jgi:hypothetical protein
MILKTRIYLTAIVTILIWLLLAWDHYHGGVPSHHLLADKDLPAVSNWWGGLLLPVLTWFLLYRIDERISGKKNLYPHISTSNSAIFGFISALLFGVVLSVFFSMGNQNVPGYMLLALFPAAIIFPISKSEYLLGFVLGMTFTFGPVLPILIGAILIILAATLYFTIRPGIIFITSKFLQSKSNNK